MSSSVSTLFLDKVPSSAHFPEGRAPEEAPQRRLLVTLPALNEEKMVGQVVRGVPRDIPGVHSVEVLVVDDGSDDRTTEEALAAGAEVIRHARPQGVGAAFHSALAYGIEHGADLIVTIDSDGQFNPADIPALIEPVLGHKADFSTASRFKDPALIPKMPKIKLWGNHMMSWLISSLAREKFYDVSCGMRCYSRRAALHLHLLARFTYTQEVFLNLSFKQLRIVEVPLKIRGERQFGKSRVASNLWRYGFRTAQIIFRSYRDYNPLRFFGGMAVGLFLLSFLCGSFLGIHYLTTGGFTPHKWAGVVAIASSSLAILMLHMGIIGDMLNRHRVYLEELLYRQRSERFQDDRHGARPDVIP